MGQGRTAIVAGGSIGGLFAAAALRQAGWSVHVYERTPVELAGRGAGIVTHKVLIDAFRTLGAQTTDLGVSVQDRVAFDLACDIVGKFSYPQIVTSWDRIYQILRALVPDGSYHLGRSVVGYDQDDATVTARFDDGFQAAADLLVGADGFRSAIRGQMQPDIQPQFAGYVVWRALADERQMPPEIHAHLFDKFGFFAPNGTQILGYPIAGPDNDLRAGHRRYNFVWYSEVTDDELRDMLTDATGTHYPVSIPPPRIRDDVLARMNKDAADRLPPQFLEIIQRSGRPFFTPIYDHCSPVFATGRVALTGDAACVARPHVGMGVTKAALDALALARHVNQAPMQQALRAYSAERVVPSRRARDEGQRLGALIFDGDPDQNRDGRSHPQIETIMRDTAVPIL